MDIIIYFAAALWFQRFNCGRVAFLFKVIYFLFYLIKASTRRFVQLYKMWHQVCIYIVKYSIIFHKYSRISNILNILYKEILPFWWTNIRLVRVEPNRSQAILIISFVLEEKSIARIRHCQLKITSSHLNIGVFNKALHHMMQSIPWFKIAFLFYLINESTKSFNYILINLRVIPRRLEPILEPVPFRIQKVM